MGSFFQSFGNNSVQCNDLFDDVHPIITGEQRLNNDRSAFF